jgi:hypothetical protein
MSPPNESTAETEGWDWVHPEYRHRYTLGADGLWRKRSAQGKTESRTPAGDGQIVRKLVDSKPWDAAEAARWKSLPAERSTKKMVVVFLHRE